MNWAQRISEELHGFVVPPIVVDEGCVQLGSSLLYVDGRLVSRAFAPGELVFSMDDMAVVVEAWRRTRCQ